MRGQGRAAEALRLAEETESRETNHQLNGGVVVALDLLSRRKCEEARSFLESLLKERPDASLVTSMLELCEVVSVAEKSPAEGAFLEPDFIRRWIPPHVRPNSVGA